MRPFTRSTIPTTTSFYGLLCMEAGRPGGKRECWGAPAEPGLKAALSWLGVPSLQTEVGLTPVIWFSIPTWTLTPVTLHPSMQQQDRGGVFSWPSRPPADTLAQRGIFYYQCLTFSSPTPHNQAYRCTGAGQFIYPVWKEDHHLWPIKTSQMKTLNMN